MRSTVAATRLWTTTGIVENPVLEIEDGHITRIFKDGAFSGTSTHNFPGTMLAPAFLDIHFHGAAGHDVMEGTPEALSAIGTLIAKHGTARYLATTVTAPLDETLRALSRLAQIIARPDCLPSNAARPIGIHLEGPFLSHSKRGVHPAEHLLTPDIRIFDDLFEASEGLIRVMTLAPELPGAIELIEYATALGVRVSLGHSNSATTPTRAGIDAGAISATHTFNAMRQFDHREPGILGVALADDRVYAELICDGIHVSREAVQLWWRSKGEKRSILVTDAMSATGMPDGSYQLGGFLVQVAEGRAMREGVLAGSVLTQNKALSNFIEFTGAPVEIALRLMTINPAVMTGLKLPSFDVGDEADFVVIERNGKLHASFLGGCLASA